MRDQPIEKRFYHSTRLEWDAGYGSDIRDFVYFNASDVCLYSYLQLYCVQQITLLLIRLIMNS
jgi:hypothetical protein